MTSIPIASIRLDGGTQTRTGVDQATASEYAEAMRSGAAFPSVIVFHDGESQWLADGFHRVEGARQAGLEAVPAEIRMGTLRDARLYAIGANQTHGLRRSTDDKRRAVRAMLEDAEWGTWSDREIARRCGVSHPFVAKLRAPESGNVSTPFLPEPGHGAIGEAFANGTHPHAFVWPSESYISEFDGSFVDGNAYLYVVVISHGPMGGSEIYGLRKPIRRDCVVRVLEREGFPFMDAEWNQYPVSDGPDDEAVTFERNWTWPHLLYGSKEEWIAKRWQVAS